MPTTPLCRMLLASTAASIKESVRVAARAKDGEGEEVKGRQRSEKRLCQGEKERDRAGTREGECKDDTVQRQEALGSEAVSGRRREIIEENKE